MKDNMEQLKKTQEDLSEFFCEDPKTFRMEECYKSLGKKHALKKYDQFALKTSCFWGITESNITSSVQFHEIFVTKLMNKLIYYYCWVQLSSLLNP